MSSSGSTTGFKIWGMDHGCTDASLTVMFESFYMLSFDHPVVTVKLEHRIPNNI